MLVFRNEPLVLLLINPSARMCQRGVRKTISKLDGKPVYSSNVSKLFWDLEKKGLIQKSPNKKIVMGRSSVHYKLTAKGKKVRIKLRRQAKWLYNLDTRRKE